MVEVKVTVEVEVDVCKAECDPVNERDGEQVSEADGVNVGVLVRVAVKLVQVSVKL